MNACAKKWVTGPYYTTIEANYWKHSSKWGENGSWGFVLIPKRWGRKEIYGLTRCEMNEISRCILNWPSQGATANGN